LQRRSSTNVTQPEAVTLAIALTLALVLGLTIGIAIGAVVGSVLQRRPLGICAINRDTVSRGYLLTLRPGPLAGLSLKCSHNQNPQLSQLYLLLNLSVASLVEAEQPRSGLVEETPRLSVVIVLGRGSWETDNLQVGSLRHQHFVDWASRCIPQSNYGSLALCLNLCIVCEVSCEELRESWFEIGSLGPAM
jgi:hypothetical protein